MTTQDYRSDPIGLREREVVRTVSNGSKGERTKVPKGPKGDAVFVALEGTRLCRSRGRQGEEASEAKNGDRTREGCFVSNTICGRDLWQGKGKSLRRVLEESKKRLYPCAVGWRDKESRRGKKEANEVIAFGR